MSDRIDLLLESAKTHLTDHDRRIALNAALQVQQRDWMRDTAALSTASSIR